MKSLILGCGNRERGEGEIGLDMQPPCDVKHDLNNHPLPFSDREFDEIHAYHILEHLSTQGNWQFFFAEWNEYYRILKDGGLFVGIVPTWNGKWAWGDPGHCRVIPLNMMMFLDQDEYIKQVGVTSLTDYRMWYYGNFKLISFTDLPEATLRFVLQKREIKVF